MVKFNKKFKEAVYNNFSQPKITVIPLSFNYGKNQDWWEKLGNFHFSSGVILVLWLVGVDCGFYRQL